MEYVTLSNGIKMAILGFGVFRVPDKKKCQESVYQAIKAGYRLIDTAASYTNEDAVGKAVKQAIDEGICKREDLFITSKLWVQDMKDYDAAKKGIDASIEKSGLEYIDLYLLHQALGDYFSAWRAFEDAYREGKLKAIGVSNFYPNILTNFCETVDIKPMVNQVELHPYFTQEQALETMKYYDVIPEAWAPLGGGRYNPFEDKMLIEIAEKYNKSVGQVLLRWNIQRGVVVIPKSTHLERIKENLENGISARALDYNEDEQKLVKDMFLLTTKPILYIANISEEQMENAENDPLVQKVKEYASKENAEVIPLCVKIEEELSGLDDNDKKEMLDALGLDESGLDKVIKKSYDLLGLMSFLTAGEPEVRAWTIKKGTKAPQAAGKIHSDIERGFIKAEVISFDELMKCGSMVAAKEKGLVRQEGKDYIMQDGDIVLFKFNV